MLLLGRRELCIIFFFFSFWGKAAVKRMAQGGDQPTLSGACTRIEAPDEPMRVHGLTTDDAPQPESERAGGARGDEEQPIESSF